MSARWAAAAVLERLRAADEGWFPIVSRDGVPIYNAFAHVKFSDWIAIDWHPRRRAVRSGTLLHARC